MVLYALRVYIISFHLFQVFRGLTTSFLEVAFASEEISVPDCHTQCKEAEQSEFVNISNEA